MTIIMTLIKHITDVLVTYLMCSNKKYGQNALDQPHKVQATKLLFKQLCDFSLNKNNTPTKEM